MAVSLAEFVDRLAGSGLLARGDVQASVAGLPGNQQPKDGRQLARLLVIQNKLTAYQAEQIYSDNGQSLVLGNYVILDKLGQGGMGMVFKAEHRRMKRVVAIKVMAPAFTETPEALRRFQREVEAAAKLDHANIVTAYDADQAGRTHFLVMQYVAGTDLSAFVKGKGPMAVDHAVNCVLQAASGLEYAHSRGVVHRDIKPSNLVLDQAGTVKVLDMGLARIASAGADQDQLTGTGQIMGTIDYMAPEQALDTRHADARADIYALGLTLWYLLTGRAAYPGDSAMARLLAHRESPIPSLSAACPDAPPRLNEIFARMVAKQPQDRYQTMGQVIAALESFRDGSPVMSSTNAAPGEDSRWNALVSYLVPASGEPAVKQALRRKRNKPAPPGSGLESTAILPSNRVDIDPQAPAQMSLAPMAMQNVRAGRRPADRPGKETHGLTPRLPRSRAGLFWAGGGGAALLLLGVVIFIAQPGAGTIRVEISDPRIEVAIKGTEIVLKQADHGKDVRLSPRETTLVIRRGDFQFETDKLILKRGRDVTVRVERLPGALQVRQGDKLIGQKRLIPPPLAIAPFDEPAARNHQRVWADYLDLPREKEIKLPGGETLTLVLIPPGEFLMGSTPEERAKSVEAAKAAKDVPRIELIPTEGPLHRVRITRPFYLGKYEVTQAQWQSVMGSNPSHFKDDSSQPLEMVGWDEFQPFLDRLNKGSSIENLTFALPTEAQWEYACRAGATKLYHGESENDGREYGWFSWNSRGKTHPVGALRANGFGLHDMHGNVWEWCADWYAEDSYANAPVKDPTGPSAGWCRVDRGGSYNCSPIGLSAARAYFGPDHCADWLGFRVAASIGEKGVVGEKGVGSR